MRESRGVLLVAVLLAAAACRQVVEDDGRPTAGEADTRLVIDMRGRPVSVPKTIKRVATINDGFVESVMTRLGAIEAVVALGSSSQQRVWSYSYTAAGGRTYSVEDGMGTMRALHPWLSELPCASYTSGDPINYETIARARPEVVILRVGDCTVGTSADAVSRTTAVFESMGVPVIVLRSPTDYRGESLQTLRGEILVLGRVFGKEDEAVALADELSAAEALIASRVANVPDASKPRALYLGLSSTARSSGGAAYVWGRDTVESWMLEQVAGARNAYSGPGARLLLNTEQVLALDPDVIFLPTSAGYHPPAELAEAPYFADLQRLRAVRQGRVYPLPWTPMNCARRLEYPIDLMVMASAAHPDRFADVALHEWILDFYRRIYRVDEGRARLLRRAQWLDWTVESASRRLP
jgi:iron complex transport system substrate-binding protein